MSIPPPSQAPDYFSLVIDWGADLDDAIPIEADQEMSITQPILHASRWRKIVIALAAVGVVFAWIQRVRRHRRAMA